MARIRTIKPEFWSDEKMAPMSDACRLIFLALISMADDYGRLIDSEKQVEAFVWPFEKRTKDVHTSLAQLAAIGRIERGRNASGQSVIQIANWHKHQRVDKPNPNSSIREIVPEGGANSSGGVPESVANDSGSAPEKVSKDLDLGSVPRSYVRADARFAKRSTNSRKPKSERQPTWLTPFVVRWSEKVGPVKFPRAAAALRPVVDAYGEVGALAALDAYLDEPRLPDKPVKLEYFAENAARWIAESKIPPILDGRLTPRGERITRPA